MATETINQIPTNKVAETGDLMEGQNAGGGSSFNTTIEQLGTALIDLTDIMEPDDVVSGYRMDNTYPGDGTVVVNFSETVTYQGEWLFNDSTTPPPAVGEVQVNTVQVDQATEIYANDIDANGKDASFGFASTTPGDILVMENLDNSRVALFEVTGFPIDNTTYYTIPVAWQSGAGGNPGDGDRISMVWLPQGTINSVPGGGTTGQSLVKASNADFDEEWADRLEFLIQDTAPVLGGDLNANGFSIVNTYTATGGVSFQVGELGFIAPITGTISKTSANSEATAKHHTVMALEIIGAGGTGEFAETGQVKGLTGLVTGEPVFMGTGLGAHSTIPPSGSGEVVRVVGYGVSSTVMMFTPSRDWMVLV